MVIHRGEYIFNELCAFVSRYEHSRSKPVSLIQALELLVFYWQLKKNRVWSRNVVNYIGSDNIVIKGLYFTRNEYLSLTVVKDLSLIQGNHFGNTDECFAKKSYWLQTISAPHLNMS